MSRGKHIAKSLIEASQAALFACIEIHNKPCFSYRYQSAIILLVNAWELALKAYIYKHIDKKRIFIKGKQKTKNTITFSEVLKIFLEHLSEENKEYKAVIGNIEEVNKIRCEFIHYFSQSKGDDPLMLMLIEKSIVNITEFYKEFFKLEISKNDNLIILPIGFSLPIDPITFITNECNNNKNALANEVIQEIRNLHDQGIQDSIVVGFDINLNSVKKIPNADIIAAIDNSQKGVSINLKKEYKITDNPSAQTVTFEDESRIFPLRYADLQKEIKRIYPEIKFNKEFNKIMERVKEDTHLSRTRLLDPKNESKSQKKTFYSKKVIDFVVQEWHKDRSS